MKQIILHTLIFISFQLCFSQNEKPKKGIKRIMTTEMIRELYSSGKYYNKILETNETFYGINGKKLKTIRTSYRNSKPKNRNITKFHYNKKNKIDHAISFIQKDSTKFKTYYDYNDSILVKKHFSYIKDGTKFTFKESYNHDSNGKLISSHYAYFEKYIDSNEEDYITYFGFKEKYDKKQRTYEMDYTESDTVYKNNIFRYKWRKNNVLLNEKEYDKYGELLNKISYKYSYDDRKNWILKKAYKNKQLYKTTVREIEYYNKTN